MRYASLRQGLVGCWCPSVSGPYGYRLPDLSGYGNHGTLTNMDPPNDWVASGGKGALDFDGSNDWVSASKQGQSNYALSVWFKIRSLPNLNNDGVIFSTTDSAKEPFYIAVRYTFLTLTCNGYDGNVRGIYSGGPSISFNVLYHACCIASGGKYQIYLNGIKTNETTDTIISSSALNCGIGAFANGTRNFDGQIDDMRLYNRALTEQEIRLLASERGIGLKPERQRNRYLVPTPSRNRSSRFLGFPS